MKTKLIIEFRDEGKSATISLVDEEGNGEIILTGLVHGGTGSDKQIDQCKCMLREMVTGMNAYREVNDYDKVFSVDDSNVGCTFKDNWGKIFLCHSYEPGSGYWMQNVDHPNELHHVPFRDIGTVYIKL